MPSALTPGTTLTGKDIVEPGPGSRLLIRLQDGSHVKLGENARLELADLKPVSPSTGILSAVLNVIRGAFRFTTQKLTAGQKPDVRINIATLVIGIRGTDVWGKAASDRNILCLIDGRIDVEDRANDRVFEMVQPLTFYIAPHGRPPLPVQPVPQAKLEGWAQETELTKGMGILRENGRWVVHLLSYISAEHADHARRKLQHAGYPATIREVFVKGRTWYRVSVPGFINKAEAWTFRKNIEGRFGITTPWVSKE